MFESGLIQHLTHMLYLIRVTQIECLSQFDLPRPPADADNVIARVQNTHTVYIPHVSGVPVSCQVEAFCLESLAMGACSGHCNGGTVVWYSCKGVVMTGVVDAYVR